MSALHCGCDPECGWTCERHLQEQEEALTAPPVEVAADAEDDEAIAW